MATEISKREIPQVRSVNATLLRAILRHRVRLLMLENGVVDKIYKVITPSINRFKKGLKSNIVSSVKESHPWQKWDDIEEAEAVDVTTSRAKIIADNIVAQVKQHMDEPLANVQEILRDALAAIARNEVDMVAAMLAKALPAGILAATGISISSEIPLATLTQFVNAPLGGLDYAERLIDRYGDDLDTIRAELFNGLVQGDSVVNITKSLSDKLSNLIPSSIERLVRTEIMRVSNASLAQLYRDNSDIIEKVQYVGTLDWKTCMICGEYDGQVFDSVDDGPELPMHPHCRCVYAPVTKSWKDMGLDIEDVPDTVRASMNGTVPASTNYWDFFMDQDEDFQRRALGDTRFELWQNGKIDLDQLVTRERIRSIRELRALAEED